MSRPRRGNGPFEHIRHAKKRAVLTAYSACGNAVKACEAAQIDHSTLYHWRKVDPELNAAWLLAREIAAERLEGEAFRRATQAEAPSDTLLIFLLKGRMPDVYRERSSVELSGPAGGPVEVAHDSRERIESALAGIASRGGTPSPAQIAE